MSLETLIPVTCPCGESVFAEPDHEPFPCGCGGRPRVHGPRSANLRGRIFGRWVVMGLLPRAGKKTRRWLCRCGGCGELRAVQTNNLTSGRSHGCRSCARRARDLQRVGDVDVYAGQR